MLARKEGHLEVVSYLMTKRANVNAQDKVRFDSRCINNSYDVLHALNSLVNM